MKTYLFRLLLTLTLTLNVAQLATHAALNSTPACGAINTNTTWLLANSPYDVCIGGVTVGPTATLTVEPGVVVQFQSGAGNKLNIQGGLNAIGTITQPITFTGVITTPGSWAGLRVGSAAGLRAGSRAGLRAAGRSGLWAAAGGSSGECRACQECPAASNNRSPSP